jgi:probable HAF family extracellular repeat protein
VKRTALLTHLFTTAILLSNLNAAQEFRPQQDSSHQHYPHYKVIDTGSFGGPNSHIHLGAHVLNNAGALTVSADTPDTDPYSPDGCFNGDCKITHVARWKDQELKDLGVIGAGPNSESNWLSENGWWIAGDSQNGLTDPLVGAWELRGVVWKHDKLIEVGTLGGGFNSLAWAVNNAGEVVGFSTTTTPDDNAMILQLGLPYAYQTRAFRWTDGRIEDLGTLGGTDAMALGINERGQIIGNSYINSATSTVCGLTTGGFLWESGKMLNLGSLGGSCTQVSAINDRGQVVGGSFLAGDQVVHPFLWERGRLVDLRTSGGNFGAAEFINEAGDVAGWQTVAGNDGIFHATLWSRGRIIDLGAPGPGQCSQPFGINAYRQVVGITSSDCNFGDELGLRAFLWQPGLPMVDVNTLISPALGIQLRNIATINDRGEMAAVGAFANGDRRPVILVPCDDHDSEQDCQDQ